MKTLLPYLSNTTIGVGGDFLDREQLHVSSLPTSTVMPCCSYNRERKGCLTTDNGVVEDVV